MATAEAVSLDLVTMSSQDGGNDEKTHEETQEDTSSNNWQSPPRSDVEYEMPLGGAPPGQGGEFAPQPPAWPQFNPYEQSAMYGMHPQMQQQQNYNMNWQPPPYYGPPPGYFAPAFGPSYPPYEGMYHPGHPASYVPVDQLFPSWHSNTSSAGSSGSAASYSRRGSGSSRSPRRTRRASEKKQGRSTSTENRFDASMTLHQIKGRVANVAKDQDGSRFIQQRLAVADNEEIDLVFEEAMAAIEDLWNDVYGNFIIQKLLEFGTPDMKEKIGKRLQSGAISLSTRVFGCRVIQKAFDELENRDAADLISTLKGNVVLCLRDHNGNHVIQKAIKSIFSMAKEAQDNGEEALCTVYLSCIDPILDEIVASVQDFSKHPYACRAVQRMVEHCIGPQRPKILDSIVACRDSLLEHPYGNFVVQKVLTYGRDVDRDAIFQSLAANNSVIKFSKQKQASNVVELMLRLGTAIQRQQMVLEILNCFCVDQKNATESAVVSMAKDQYANYVIKTALEVLEEGEQLNRLYAELLSNLAELESVSFAKQIVAKINAYEASQMKE